MYHSPDFGAGRGIRYRVEDHKEILGPPGRIAHELSLDCFLQTEMIVVDIFPVVFACDEVDQSPRAKRFMYQELPVAFPSPDEVDESKEVGARDEMKVFAGLAVGDVSCRHGLEGLYGLL